MIITYPPLHTTLFGLLYNDLNNTQLSIINSICDAKNCIKNMFITGINKLQRNTIVRASSSISGKI